MNIPIYRAKKIDSDKYIQGYLLGMWGEYFISWGETNHVPNKVQIDPTTLAIHFKDMVDSEGNKIFASLSGDGKGGDMVEVTITFRKQEYKYECYVYYKNTRIKTSSFEVNSAVSKELKVIGIQE